MNTWKSFLRLFRLDYICTTFHKNDYLGL